LATNHQKATLSSLSYWCLRGYKSLWFCCSGALAAPVCSASRCLPLTNALRSCDATSVTLRVSESCTWQPPASERSANSARRRACPPSVPQKGKIWACRPERNPQASP